MKTWVKVVGLVAAWEGAWWAIRRAKRSAVFKMAVKDAKDSGRRLVVVGAPDRGATSGPGCGDVTIDIGDSSCPNFIKADITKRLPFDDNSVTVFVSCVLEYVGDYDAALAELKRVAGDHLYIVRVEPWTLTAYLYPGAKRRLALPSGKVLR
jgi:Methyltransferase domain